MSKSKKEAMAIVFAAAENYQAYFVNQSLLLLCMDKHKHTYCIEATFDRTNFQHLTGIETDFSGISADHFFQLCIDRRLKESDFEFAPNGTTMWKLDALPSIICQSPQMNMIGFYNGVQPLLATERLAGGIKACIGFVQDKHSGRYIPNTLLKDDIRSLTNFVDHIIVTYRKHRDENEYKRIVSYSKKIDWDTILLPARYDYLPLPNNNES